MLSNMSNFKIGMTMLPTKVRLAFFPSIELRLPADTLRVLASSNHYGATSDVDEGDVGVMLYRNRQSSIATSGA